MPWNYLSSLQFTCILSECFNECNRHCHRYLGKVKFFWVNWITKRCQNTDFTQGGPPLMVGLINSFQDAGFMFYLRKLLKRGYFKWNFWEKSTIMISLIITFGWNYCNNFPKVLSLMMNGNIKYKMEFISSSHHK